MRRLNGHDIFAAVRVTKEAGMKEEVKKIAALLNAGKKLNIREIGIEFVVNMLGGLADVGAEDKFWKFCAGPFEMTEKEVAELPIMDVIEKFKELAALEDAEAWKTFFRSVAQLTK